MHWRLTLSYDGGPFHGWQVQPGLATVQGTLANVIEHLTGEVVLPQGSGRTDAGVHALAQTVTFSLAAPIPATNLQHALNRALPPSIRVLSAAEVPATFHARHSAVRKSYEYRIHERRIPETLTTDPDQICSPFLAPYTWDCRWMLDLASMEQAATLILGTHDFTSFAASDPDKTQRYSTSEALTLNHERSATSVLPVGVNPIKTIDTSTFVRESNLLIYRVSGSGFLHHMVRNLVGTFVDIGRGALPPADIPKILTARDRTSAGPTAPAQGLYLVSVDYQ